MGQGARLGHRQVRRRDPPLRLHHHIRPVHEGLPLRLRGGGARRQFHRHRRFFGPHLFRKHRHGFRAGAGQHPRHHRHDRHPHSGDPRLSHLLQEGEGIHPHPPHHGGGGRHRQPRGQDAARLCARLLRVHFHGLCHLQHRGRLRDGGRDRAHRRAHPHARLPFQGQAHPAG